METQKLVRVAEVSHPSRWPSYIPMLIALGIFCAPASLLLAYQLYQSEQVWSQKYEDVLHMDDRLVWKIARENDDLALKNAALERRLDETLGMAGEQRMLEVWSSCLAFLSAARDKADTRWDGHYGYVQRACATAAKWYESRPFSTESFFDHLGR
jgi:hypothetical protein